MKKAVVEGKIPRIDMSHGFVRSIQKQLTEQAVELNMVPPKTEYQGVKVKEERMVQPLMSVVASSAVGYGPSITDIKTLDADVQPCSLQKIVELADLPRYIPEAQRVIQLAIKDPKELSQTELDQVSLSLVERAIEDFGYYDVAAILCGHICKNEEGRLDLNTIPEARFIRAILGACDLRMTSAIQMRKADIHYWINFCLFLAGLYLQVHLPGGRLYELQRHLFKILDYLSRPPAVENPAEVNALAMVYRQCGQELCRADPSAFDSLVCNLRDAFIKGSDAQSNSILLMLVELYASNWSLSNIAKEYYGLG